MGNIHPTAKIHPSSIIYDNVQIGPNVTIGPFCIIGAPAEWKGKEGEDKGVRILANTVITGLVTIDSGVEKTTVVCQCCYIMKHAHIGHDAFIGNWVTISCGAKVGGHSVIGNMTNIGLNAVIHQKITIPEGCMIGASAFIGKTLEMKPYSKYAGVPARYIGENVRP